MTVRYKRGCAHEASADDIKSDSNATTRAERISEQRIVKWIHDVLRQWDARIAAHDPRVVSDPVFGLRSTLDTVKFKIAPLLSRLNDIGRDVDNSVLRMLDRMMELACAGDFQGATQEYMDGTIAHTQWHDGFQKAMPAGGNKANPGLAKRVCTSFDPRNALYETEAYEYLLSFKRLVAVYQLLHAEASS